MDSRLELYQQSIWHQGTKSVALFFILSGYIFFATYGDRIASGRMSPRQFFVLRFSRLYPLHAVTLLIVAALQYLLMRQTGRYFIYDHNTSLYFVANALLIQFGWFSNEMTFNGPSWSICVEAYLYLCFFFFARRLAANLPARFVVAGISFAVMLYGDFSTTGPLNPYMCEGLGCFFAGGCLQAMSSLERRINLAIGFALIGAGAAMLPVLGSRPGLALGIFPGVVLAACSSRTFASASRWRLFAWLGDISYSTYLWHFPVQLALVAFAAFVAPVDFSAKLVFWLYVATVMSAGTLSFRFLETPARIALRRWAAQPRASRRGAEFLTPS